jgi:hypothetical protein
VQRSREPVAHHHHQPNQFWQCVEAIERVDKLHYFKLLSAIFRAIEMTRTAPNLKQMTQRDKTQFFKILAILLLNMEIISHDLI